MYPCLCHQLNNSHKKCYNCESRYIGSFHIINIQKRCLYLLQLVLDLIFKLNSNLLFYLLLRIFEIKLFCFSVDVIFNDLQVDWKISLLNEQGWLDQVKKAFMPYYRKNQIALIISNLEAKTTKFLITTLNLTGITHFSFLPCSLFNKNHFLNTIYQQIFKIRFITYLGNRTGDALNKSFDH